PRQSILSDGGYTLPLPPEDEARMRELDAKIEQNRARLGYLTDHYFPRVTEEPDTSKPSLPQYAETVKRNGRTVTLYNTEGRGEPVLDENDRPVLIHPM